MFFLNQLESQLLPNLISNSQGNLLTSLRGKIERKEGKSSSHLREGEWWKRSSAKDDKKDDDKKGERVKSRSGIQQAKDISSSVLTNSQDSKSRVNTVSNDPSKSNTQASETDLPKKEASTIKPK